MLDKRGKQKLENYMLKSKTNLCKHIYITHRYFNEWAQKQWKADGWTNIRPEQLRLIAILRTDVVNNNELAKRARVSKQAMSKMVNELEKYGYIDVNPDPNDSRAKIVSVSNKGADFLEYFYNCNRPIEKQFAGILGEEKLARLIQILSELTEGILEYEKKMDEVRK